MEGLQLNNNENTQKATMHCGTDNTPDYVALGRAGNILILVRPFVMPVNHVKARLGLRIRAHTDNGMPMPAPDAGLFVTEIPWSRMNTERYALDAEVLEFPSIVVATEDHEALQDKLIAQLLDFRTALLSRVISPQAEVVEGTLPIQYLVDFCLNTVVILESAGSSNVVAFPFPDKKASDQGDDSEQEDGDD